MVTLLVFTVLAAAAAIGAVHARWRAYATRPRTAVAPSPHRELVVRRAAFPLPVAHTGDSDYDPLYSIPSRKSLGEASRRRRPFRPLSVITLGARPSHDLPSLFTRSTHDLCAAAEHAVAPLVIAPEGVRFETLGSADLVLQIGDDASAAVDPAGRLSFARLIEMADAYRQVKAVEIVLGQHTSRLLPIHDADSLLDLCESIAGAAGLPVGIRATADDIPFWMDLTRLMDRTNRYVDFVTIPGRSEDLLTFAIGFSRVQKLFAMRSLHGRTGFIGARGSWTAHEALFGFALGCDFVEINRPPARRSAGLASSLISARRDLLTACRESGALHPADVLATHVEVIDPPCWSRSVAELFGGRGVGSACGDERHFIEIVDRSGNALPFRRKH
jgi:hypothetical protein